ncbi:MAG: hypothetical protein HQL46_05915 [Gammaproteobacteria bacterium]|nr:hypothetical protein [Gammaproteobacteria bacterium]
MKLHSILLVGLLSSSICHAQTFSVDRETFDCAYAANTARFATNLKSQGMDLNSLEKFIKNMPAGSTKEMQEYYSKIGFQSHDSDKSYQRALALCKFNRQK